MEPMEMPSVEEVRNRIEGVLDLEIRNCLMTAYLFAGRISEVVSEATATDNTTARGPRGSDARMEIYKVGQIEEPVVVFSVKTAKRQGEPRRVAIPYNFEPWVKPVFQYFQDREKDAVFPFTRQKAGIAAQRIFTGLSYPIERYVWKIGELKTVVNKHMKPFRLHALRHLRATELVEFYGFDGFDLSIYGGWTFKVGAQVSSVMSRYLSLGWQRYIPKLLKRRD